MIGRRTLLAGGAAAAGLWAAGARAAAATPVAEQRQRLRVGARETEMSVWTPAKPKAVALFSTGHGSWPSRYAALAQLLATEGVATVAPLHVDSMHHPDRENFTLEAGFGERIADMRAASGHAAATWRDLPVFAAGHSFGTLTALCLGGGLAYAGPFRDPAVRAVLAFSSPGRIPGLVQPTAYTTVSVPVMLVTGTADLVPGFVTDPADHLLAPQTVAGPSYALVVDGAAHELVAAADPRFRRAVHAAELFVRAHVLGSAAAARQLARWQPAKGDRFTVRNAA
jgi:alpha-beta hydrolase superfamily lysophospholipase